MVRFPPREPELPAQGRCLSSLGRRRGGRSQRRCDIDVRVGHAKRFSGGVLCQPRMQTCGESAPGTLRRGTRGHSSDLPYPLSRPPATLAMRARISATPRSHTFQ